MKVLIRLGMLGCSEGVGIQFQVGARPFSVISLTRNSEAGPAVSRLAAGRMTKGSRNHLQRYPNQHQIKAERYTAARGGA